jgi:hypothetical protein
MEGNKMMTTPMTKEELTDALLEIAKQAYQEGKTHQQNDHVTKTFEDTKTHKQIMDNI